LANLLGIFVLCHDKKACCCYPYLKLIYNLPANRFDLIQAIVVTLENITIYYNGYAPTRQMQNTVSFGTVGQQAEEYDFGRREA